MKTDAGVNPSAAHLGKSQPTPADQEQAPLILSYTHTAGYPTSLYDTVTHTLTWLATKLGFDVNMYSSGFQKSTPPVQIAGVCVCQCTKQQLRVPTLLGVLGGCAGALTPWERPPFSGRDLNVDVGNDSDSGTRKGVIGREQPLPDQNSSVFQLLGFCGRDVLSITNTMFKVKGRPFMDLAQGHAWAPFDH